MFLTIKTTINIWNLNAYEGSSNANKHDEEITTEIKIINKELQVDEISDTRIEI